MRWKYYKDGPGGRRSKGVHSYYFKHSPVDYRDLGSKEKQSTHTIK